MVGRRVLNAAAPANSFKMTELKVEKNKTMARSGFLSSCVGALACACVCGGLMLASGVFRYSQCLAQRLVRGKCQITLPTLRARNTHLHTGKKLLDFRPERVTSLPSVPQGESKGG